MLIPSRRLFFIEIPKTGTTSVKKALAARYEGVAQKGHLPLSALLNWCEKSGEPKPIEAVALIRCPIERFVSAINYDFGDTKEPLEQAVRRALKEQRSQVYRLQSSYVDSTEIPVTLFAFEDMGLALQYMGCDTVAPHENKGPARWNWQDLKPWHEEIEQFVADDWPLRRKVMYGGRVVGQHS